MFQSAGGMGWCMLSRSIVWLQDVGLLTFWLAKNEGVDPYTSPSLYNPVS